MSEDLSPSAIDRYAVVELKSKGLRYINEAEILSDFWEIIASGATVVPSSVLSLLDPNFQSTQDLGQDNFRTLAKNLPEIVGPAQWEAYRNKHLGQDLSSEDWLTSSHDKDGAQTLAFAWLTGSILFSISQPNIKLFSNSKSQKLFPLSPAFSAKDFKFPVDREHQKEFVPFIPFDSLVLAHLVNHPIIQDFPKVKTLLCNHAISRPSQRPSQSIPEFLDQIRQSKNSESNAAGHRTPHRTVL